MANNHIKYFRVYHEMIDDYKLLEAAIEAEEELATVWGVWIALLAMANKSTPRDGRISFLGKRKTPERYIIQKLGITDMDRAKRIVAALADPELEMLDLEDERGWYIVNWNDNQAYSDHSGAKRQAEYRKRQKEKKKIPEKEKMASTEQTGEPTNPAKGKRKPEDSEETIPQNSTTTNGAVQEVIDHFVNETGHWPPADPVQLGMEWESPIESWLDQADGDVEVVKGWLDEGLRIHRGKGYAHTRPKNFRNTIGNMANQADLSKLWNEFEGLVLAYGPRNKPEMSDALAKVLKVAGGWGPMHGLNESVAREKFSEAYRKVIGRERKRNTRTRR